MAHGAFSLWGINKNQSAETSGPNSKCYRGFRSVTFKSKCTPSGHMFLSPYKKNYKTVNFRDTLLNAYAECRKSHLGFTNSEIRSEQTHG